jgi:hypothetical protein
MLTCLGISTNDPRLKKSFKGYGLRWLSNLRTHKSSFKDLTIKVMHESLDPNVIKQWRDYYYDCWNVLNNPKFIHSFYRRKRPTMIGFGNPLYGKSPIKAHNLRWYNDGYSKSIFVTENTQPKGYVLGRIINHRTKISELGKANIRAAQSKPCIGPNGRRYKSVKEAAKQCHISVWTIYRRIKASNGWRYV